MDRKKRHLISINSKHNKSNNPSNARYTFSQIDLHESRGVKLKDIAIVNLIYNVETGRNDVLDYDFNGVQKSITIPAGAYDASTLLLAINGLQTDIVFGVNISTQKYTVTSASPSFLKGSSTIKNVLGFSVDGAPSTSYQLPNPFNFIRTHYINILNVSVSLKNRKFNLILSN